MSGPNLPAKANPCCGHVTDTGLSPFEPGARPRAGDINLCLNCGEILVYTSDENDSRLARAGEVQELAGEDFKVLMRMRDYILKRRRIKR